MTPEEQFLAQLELIDRVIAAICRRHSCYGADAEDFASSVKLKLIDNDYAVIRKFQGKSLLATYLTTVVANLFRDERIRKWGKWRASATAERLGAEARNLEQLIYRDGFSLEESVAKLVSDARVSLSRQELNHLAGKLPVRKPRVRVEGELQLPDVASDDRIDDGILDRHRTELQAKTETALGKALADLPPEDRLILRMRYDGHKVSNIAKILRLPQRSLYSRLEKNLKQLRQALEAEGLNREEMQEIFGWKGFDVRLDYGLEDEEEEADFGGKKKKSDENGGKSDSGPSNSGGGL